MAAITGRPGEPRPRIISCCFCRPRRLVGRCCVDQVRQMVCPDYERRTDSEAWISGDTGDAKKGQPLGWGAHRNCGQLGKQANCQVAVTLCSNRHASCRWRIGCICRRRGRRDDDRRARWGCPRRSRSKTKPQIALEQIRWDCEVGLPGDMVLVDDGSVTIPKLRAGITELGKNMWPEFQPPRRLVWKPGKRPGRARRRGHRDAPVQS